MDPTALFSYERHVDSRALHGRTLLVTLGAFGDAGHAQQILDDHVLNSLENRVVGRLDMDQVHDYTGNRPVVTLDRDEFTDYERPEILLHEVTDPSGETFFLLTGPEPSFQWERVASSLRIVVEQLGIETTLVAQGFPAPVPHTRALQVSRFAGDRADISHPRPVPATFRLRSSFTSLLTMRLHDAGHTVVGLAVQVPQYLHELDYPDAAISLLRAVHEEGGPEIAIGALAPMAENVRESIAQQVAASPQLQEMVRSLEENADRMGIGAPIDDSEVPDAEEIAAEIEKYLAGLDGEDDTEHDEDEGPSTPEPPRED
ncbi:PAC2 family protein [Brachybacterium endophyticum]|uniref:PAC2 family protein n=1 Tax=Brachybacterium endophyticum TaxID=2182385 RepID=A0A2U2RIM0_9MICO|nr:PAC2 family protein [Brachybacterium endophyticum]PWH05732.1 PAC2 family protein [Brachybacterium endophyticum]